MGGSARSAGWRDAVGVWDAENVGFERGARAALRAIARGEDAGGGRRLLTRFSRGGLGDALETVLVDVGALVSARARRGGGGTRPTRSPRMSTPSRFGTRVPPRRATRRRRRPASSLAHARPVVRGRGRGGSPERARETRRERRRSFAARAPLSSPGSTIVPPRDRAWTRLARRFVRRRESFCAFRAGRLPSRARCGAGDGFRNPRRSGKTRVWRTLQKMSVCTNV